MSIKNKSLYSHFPVVTHVNGDQRLDLLGREIQCCLVVYSYRIGGHQSN